ncbi:hypothetical protein LTR17_005820 [Elasticomyces elasticus]|nr:hypothetical protein LTR17_005820 [Elasticomyces elasticus]
MATRRSERVTSRKERDQLKITIAESKAQNAASCNRKRTPRRRSDRIPGAKLADAFEEIIAQTQANVYQEIRDARESSYAGITCKFSRLFDLPPELRAIIYTYAMEPEPGNPRRSPAIVFSNGLFRGFISSNYPDIAILDQEEHFNPVNLDPADRLAFEKIKATTHLACGLFRSPGSSRSVFTGLRKREQRVPIFRNIQFEVFAGYMEPGVPGVRCEEITVAITVATSRQMRPQLSLLKPEKASRFPNELQKVFERVRVKVDAIADAKQTFLGFTLKELEVIAMEFCYWPVFD